MACEQTTVFKAFILIPPVKYSKAVIPIAEIRELKQRKTKDQIHKEI